MFRRKKKLVVSEEPNYRAGDKLVLVLPLTSYEVEYVSKAPITWWNKGEYSVVRDKYKKLHTVDTVALVRLPRLSKGDK